MVAPPQNDPRHAEAEEENPAPASSMERSDDVAAAAVAPTGLLQDDDITKSKESREHNTAKKNASSSSLIGTGIARLSDCINDNLIAARYGALATIGLLTAYGISQTPLFFRYRTVADIPARCFVKRRYIHGRLMLCHHKNKTVSQQQPVTCYIRHLSPMERLFSKAWLDRLWKLHPAKTLRGAAAPEESAHELLHVQIAGIQYPPTLIEQQNENNNNTSSSIRSQISLPSMFDDNDDTQQQQQRPASSSFLEQLARQRTLVKCQLLGRRVVVVGAKDHYNETSTTSTGIRRAKRPIPGMSPQEQSSISNIENTAVLTDQGNGSDNQMAVAKLYFYDRSPNNSNKTGGMWHWFRRLRRDDLGETLVLKGNAIVVSDAAAGLYLHDNNNSDNTATKIVDTTDTVTDLQKDATYLEIMLGRAEYRAARGRYGVWANPAYRASRRDIVTEINFQETAGVWQKAWRWISRQQRQR